MWENILGTFSAAPTYYLPPTIVKPFIVHRCLRPPMLTTRKADVNGCEQTVSIQPLWQCNASYLSSNLFWNDMPALFAGGCFGPRG